MSVITQKQIRKSNDQLKQFVQKVFSKHRDLERNFISSMNSKMNTGVYAIDDESGVVVVATTHQSTWHPHCVYVRLAYDFNRVNNGSLHLMIDKLKEQIVQPLFFLIDNRFEGLDEVLLNKGMRLIRKTEVILIRPRKCEVLTNGRKVKAISEISNEPILMTSLFELCKRTYTETHLDNPVGDFPIASWEGIIMEDMKEDNSYVVINENKVIAYSFMYPVDARNWEIGWIGTQDRTEMNLLDLLISKQLKDAVRSGIKTIEKEIDSTCPFSMHIVESLTYEASETWSAFMSKIEVMESFTAKKEIVDHE
ncbi:hypothetical protein [Sporosarcina sp. 6E9]|uniref:hypothetical protein n=1 Tax=Sporosarcina sp. 6E9 TaxID=2819235 RepID=UPI001B302AC3|nr:hypothetical protein [Sporosarcina sp. 6E9]